MKTTSVKSATVETDLCVGRRFSVSMYCLGTQVKSYTAALGKPGRPSFSGYNPRHHRPIIQAVMFGEELRSSIIRSRARSPAFLLPRSGFPPRLGASPRSRSWIHYRAEHTVAELRDTLRELVTRSAISVHQIARAEFETQVPAHAQHHDRLVEMATPLNSSPAMRITFPQAHRIIFCVGCSWLDFS